MQQFQASQRPTENKKYVNSRKRKRNIRIKNILPHFKNVKVKHRVEWSGKWL